MANRLAEMQLEILWEEIMLRFDKVEIVRGYTKMPVVLHPKA
jgi:hypothetical protein|tara:strand:+ start:78 stop:203 length:126 start_codon:yes stop_codon:yes gene_type:complete